MHACTTASDDKQLNAILSWLLSRLDLFVGDGHLNINSGLDVDGSDVLDNAGGGVEVDQTLVDAHLEAVPSLGTLTVGGLSCGDPEKLSRHPHRALDVEVLLLSALDELGADLLEALDVSASQSDADAVEALFLDSLLTFLVLLHGGGLNGSAHDRSSG